MTESKSQAIVPAEDRPLADPTKAGWFRPGTKLRYYAEFETEVVPRRAGETPEVRCLIERKESGNVYDLSNIRMKKLALSITGFGAFIFSLLGLVYPFAGISAVASALTSGLLGGNISFLYAMIFSGCMTKRREKKIYRTRPNDSAEIDRGVETLLLAANGAAERGAHRTAVPVESLFRGLAHEDEETRQLSADLLNKMPYRVRVEGFVKFCGYLTFEQVKLLLGRGGMTPEEADLFNAPEVVALLDKRKHPWPKYIDTL